MNAEVTQGGVRRTWRSGQGLCLALCLGPCQGAEALNYPEAANVEFDQVIGPRLSPRDTSSACLGVSRVALLVAPSPARRHAKCLP